MSDKRKIDLIVVHCADTYPDMDIGVNEIRQWHLDRGWTDVGYHFIIRRSGVVEKGRDLEVIGAHVRGYNDTSIGVCLVGGKSRRYQADFNFTRHQMKALRELLVMLEDQFPMARVLGHRDIPEVAKACPSFDVQSWWYG